MRRRQRVIRISLGDERSEVGTVGLGNAEVSRESQRHSFHCLHFSIERVERL